MLQSFVSMVISYRLWLIMGRCPPLLIPHSTASLYLPEPSLTGKLFTFMTLRQCRKMTCERALPEVSAFVRYWQRRCSVRVFPLDLF